MRFRLELLVVTFCCSAFAQDQRTDSSVAPPVAPTVTLEALGVPSASSEPLSAVLAPVVCDQDQNLYFRRIGTGGTSAPLVRLSNNGRSSAVFDANKTPGFTREVDVLSFTVDVYGRVHQIVRVEEGKRQLTNYIVSFSKDGQIIGKTRLSADMIPYSFVALERGDYFLSGMGIKQSRNDVPKSVTGIFDESGNLKKDLRQKGDDPEPTRVPESTGQQANESARPSGNPAIENGMAFYGLDKNIYLFRASNPVELIIMNESGEVVRRRRLRAPFEHGQAFEFRVGLSKVMVGFREPREKQAPVTNEPVYTIFDAETGEPILNYRFGASVRGALGCFTGDRFTFLTGTRDGHLAILEAK